MSYKLTPEQYKDAARQRVSNQNTAENTNSAVAAYARMLNSTRALDNKNKQNETVEQPQESSGGKSKNWFLRTLSTIAEPVLRVTEGAAKFVENALVDSASGLIATGLDVVGLDGAAKEVQDFAAKDYVGEAFDWKPIESIYNSSYSNEWGKFGDILQEGLYTVGNQAIPFALNFVPGVGPALSRTAFALNAYGASFESASQDGGSVLGASAYGAVSASLEMAIENFGGWKVGVNEKKAIENAAKKVAQGPLRKILADAIAEGGEEVVSGLFDNYIKAMTYKGDYSSVESYFKNLAETDPATLEELLEQFTIGAVSGGMMGGANIAIRKASATMNASETIQEIKDLETKGYNLNRIGRDTTAMETEINKREQKLVETVNKNLDKFKERAKDNKSISASIMAYMDGNFNVDENGRFTTSKNSLVKHENVSYGMRESVLKDALTDGDVVHTVHEGAFEGQAAQSKTSIQKAVVHWNKRLGRNRLNVVFADMQDNQNYGYIKNNTVVINAAHLGKTVDFTVTENGVKTKYAADAGMSTLLHEVLHFTDNTKAGKTLKETLVKYAKETALAEEVEEAYPDASLERLSSEISARQLENLLFNEKIINYLTADNSTLAKRILNKATRLLNALKGKNLAETKEVERLLGKTVKLYNKAIAQKGKGKTISVKAVDKKDEKDYDNTTQYSRRVDEDGREEDRTENGSEGNAIVTLHRRTRGSLSVRIDDGRVRELREIVEDRRKLEEITRFAKEIYTQPKSDLQETLLWHAKNEDLELYFVKRNETRADLGVFHKNNLFLYENATEKQLVDILNTEKPIQRNIDYSKIAKISTERWDSFLSWKPDAYVTRISIEQFLKMTTESYVDQRQIHALANQYAKNATVEDIKNSYKDAIYLEIDFETGKVTDHNGRHRLTQLLNAGNGYADVFVVVKGKADFEAKNSVEIKGQFNDNVYQLGLVRANNKQFSKAIEATFRKEDSNIRYSRRVKETNNERSDEFRRIQEESLAMSDGAIQGYHKGAELSAEIRGRLSRIYREEIHTSRSRNGNRYGVLNHTGDFVVYKNVDADLFHDIFEINRNYLENGELVDLHAVQTTEDGIGYEDCTNYITDDGLSGFSVTPDGDLISVFNLNERRGFLRAISNEIKAKAKTLDCYNSKNQPLAGMYTKHFGFKVASIMDYNMEYDHDNIAENHGKPQVCFMVNTEQTVQERHFTETQYDEAVAYQQSFVQKRNNGEIRHSRRVVNQEELKRSIDNAVEMLIVAGDFNAEEYDVSAPKKSLAQKHLNNINGKLAKGKVSENSREIKTLVNDIFDSTILTEMPETYEESLLIVETLKPYLHSIDLTTDFIKPNVQQSYEGKNGTNRVFALWSKKGGIAWDKSVQEIVEIMPQLKKDSDGQGNEEIATLFNIFDSYTDAVKNIKKARYDAKSFVKNANEVKSLMAKQLVATLSENGTELVTKITADKLQAIINEERNALQKTLQAVQSNAKDITFEGQNVSAQVKSQLQGIVDAITQERATVYAKEKTDSLVRRLWKDVSATELQSIAKTDEYKNVAKYIAERYVENEKVSITALQDAQPAMVQELKRAVSSVKRNSVLVQNNAKAVKVLRDFDSAKLEKQLRELSLDDTHINAFKLLKTSIQGLFKESTDGKKLLLSYDEMLSSGALKEVIAAFDNYLVAENPVLQDMVDSGLFENVQVKLTAFKEYVDSLADVKYSELSLVDKQTFNNAFTVFLSSIMQATKPETVISVNGEKISARKYRDKALRAIDMMMQRDKNGDYKGEKRNMSAFFDKYFRDSVRPYEAIAMAENHAGFLESLYNEVRDGSIKGENVRADLEDLIYEFVYDKLNKVGKYKYADYLLRDEVTIKHSDGEFVVTKGELLSLYLTLMQDDGFRHADASNPMAEGIYFDSKKTATQYRNKTALKFTSENVAVMEKQLNDVDLRFIDTMRAFFERAGELKAEVDTELYGVARLLGADYYPLQTDESARDSKVGDKVSFYDALDPSGHLSINQSRTSGLKALRVRNVIDLATSYAKSVGLYYGVAVPIANMRLVYNSKGAYGMSVKDMIARRSTSAFDDYLDKLLLDVQGAIEVNDTFLERQRQRYAAFAIAANIKSPVKALSGLFSLWGRLKTTSFMNGMVSSPFKLIKSGKADFSQMYEYCPATRIRYRDKQATLAAMNVERGSKAKGWLVDKLALGIELVDKYTVYVAWNSAKAEVGAVGANANDVELLKKAGKLLNETLDTIDRFEMTERNAYSRSPDSLHRGLAMFTSSAQAQLTQFIDKFATLSRLYHLKKQLPTLIKNIEADKKSVEVKLVNAEQRLKEVEATGDKEAIRRASFELRQIKEQLQDKTLHIGELIQKQATIEKDIKKAKLFAQKTIISISMAIVVSAALSQLMSNLMGEKDEEEWGEDFAFGMLDESVSGAFSMLPFIGQFYNALEFDIGKFEKKSYDMSFWVIDEWNMLADALNSFVGLMDGTGNKTPARVARDFLYAIGQWFGIPTRNLYNIINTALKEFDSVDYKWDNLFKKGNYGSDLKKAIDSGDTELADTIMRLMMKDAFGDSDTKVVKTVRSLYEQGYNNVIPKTVSSSITINGETYNMTSKQQKAFKAIYSQADEKIERLIGKQSFVNLSPKVQADSIKWIYDYYYQEAKYDFIGLEDDSKKALFGSLVDVETLAVAYSYCNSLEADTDRKGNVISGTRKAKVVKYLNSLKVSAAEKYMILGYLGYAPVNQNAKALITAFARKNGADKAEIAELLTACNIAA